jgi:exopolysaccharide biosynthesis protein
MTSGGIRYDITGVNQGRGGNSIILYSPIWGDRTDTGNDGVELVVTDSTVRAINAGNSSLPSDGYVISISGSATPEVAENIKVGDKIDTHIKITPHTTSPSTIMHLISGGPRLIKNGVVYVSKHEEKFRADIAQGRAARTALGITSDNQVLLLAVDGLPRGKNARNGKESAGMTLEELAELLLNLGAVEAMNLDGGSSTTMWANGRVINQTVSGSQQKVSNALIVRPRF